jgi:hypothetical protein
VRSSPGPPPPQSPPPFPARGEEPAPLSFSQRRLWFLDRVEPGNACYNLPHAVRGLDEAALERALGEIVRRHEALRTVFAEADGEPVQVIASFWAASRCPWTTWQALGEAARRGGGEAHRRQRGALHAVRPGRATALPRHACSELGD